MTGREEAFRLARAMTAIGRGAGLEVVALVTAMDQPLGCAVGAVGNALEVGEAIGCLRGQGPRDLEELCLALGSHMLALAGVVSGAAEGRERLEAVLASGEALEKFRRMVEAQGGDGRVVDRPEELLPQAPATARARAPRRGWVAAIDALAVGRETMRLGAGRQRKEDAIDPAVGVVLEAKVGDFVEKGAPLAVRTTR